MQAKAFEAGSKKEKIDVRIDPRTMRALYYIKNGEILTAPLNPKKTANADFAFMSLDEYKHYRKIKKQIDRLEYELSKLGYENHVVHTEPLIMRRGEYGYLSPMERKTIFQNT